MFKEIKMRILQVLASFTLLLTLLGCATGSSIITGEVRPAISPSEVKLYIEPPVKYETIGIVEASSEVELSSQAAQDRAVQELKKQAAQSGANGVLIGNTGTQSGDSVGFYSNGTFYASSSEKKIASGKAIHVIQE
jgi:hypothetical protein